MRAFWLLLFLPVSCLQLSLPGSEDAGAAGSDSTGSSEDAATEVTGSDCVTDSVSQVTLCSSISLCENLTVDHDAYPNCGFRVAGSTIDLECLCGDDLCPVGAALSCEQARQLLADSTELMVCAQQSEGRCAARTTTHSAERSRCEQTCVESCVNSPICLESCGC